MVSMFKANYIKGLIRYYFLIHKPHRCSKSNGNKMIPVIITVALKLTFSVVFKTEKQDGTL